MAYDFSKTPYNGDFTAGYAGSYGYILVIETTDKIKSLDIIKSLFPNHGRTGLNNTILIRTDMNMNDFKDFLKAAIEYHEEKNGAKDNRIFIGESNNWISFIHPKK